MYNEILKALVSKWNEENKCDKCWVLVRTFNDYIKGQTNLYKPKQEVCCTHVFLEGVKTKPFKEYNEDFGTLKREYCEYYIHLKIAEVSDFEKSKADEYNCAENITDNVIIPLQNCVSCGLESDLCELIESKTIEIRSEESEPFFSFGDSNWAGLDLRLTIRVY